MSLASSFTCHIYLLSYFIIFFVTSSLFLIPHLTSLFFSISRLFLFMFFELLPFILILPFFSFITSLSHHLLNFTFLFHTHVTSIRSFFFCHLISHFSVSLFDLFITSSITWSPSFLYLISFSISLMWLSFFLRLWTSVFSLPLSL